MAAPRPGCALGEPIDITEQSPPDGPYIKVITDRNGIPENPMTMGSPHSHRILFDPINTFMSPHWGLIKVLIGSKTQQGTALVNPWESKDDDPLVRKAQTVLDNAYDYLVSYADKGELNIFLDSLYFSISGIKYKPRMMVNQRSGTSQHREPNTRMKDTPECLIKMPIKSYLTTIADTFILRKEEEDQMLANAYQFRNILKGGGKEFEIDLTNTDIMYSAFLVWCGSITPVRSYCKGYRSYAVPLVCIECCSYLLNPPMTSSSATPMPPRISAMENMLGRTPRVIARPDSVPIEMADIVNEDLAKLFNSLSLVMGFCAALTVYERRKGYWK